MLPLQIAYVIRVPQYGRIRVSDALNHLLSSTSSNAADVIRTGRISTFSLFFQQATKAGRFYHEVSKYVTWHVVYRTGRVHILNFFGLGELKQW